MSDMDELQETFAYFDDDGNGRIDRLEFKRLMEALGGDMPDDEMEVGFDFIDSDDDGAIEFNEFATWWMKR
ncbi:EF-hand domain-containing protein [Wenzhouxiangella sp. XN24]|uniref:EF-hand domain-containing protein n=1 Tax=Wenzhouxiangella sp. XN24 TaxID=2713569 RepID=UPI0013EB0A5D|nr:EF-hand domain-containing protein [Wenzhouxiangella sp. XN24]NGX15988.1 EF-hand domain-containing protein [Wenzhouxiangella sp. XN24]